MTTALRVVLDTKVVLSALVFTQGRLSALREAWQQGRCRPLASAATIAELLRALTYPKFKLSDKEQEELLADYLPYCSAVRTLRKPPIVPACRDPHDRALLELTMIGKADYLVTGDADLLGLASGFARPLATPAAFLGPMSKR
jgi:putative PIN family toxin of toxin-antitoxin system